MRDRHIGSLIASFCIGLCVILYVALCSVGAFQLSISDGGWINQYQTLLASFITVGSIFLVWHQYRDTKKNRRRVLRARLVRVMPLLQVHTTDCFRYIVGVIPAVPDRSKEFDLLTELIEVVDKNTAKHILKLIVFSQIHDSRLEDYDLTSSRSSFQFKQVIVDLFILSHYITQLYSYARFEVDEITSHLITLQDAHNLILNILRWDPQLRAYDQELFGIVDNHFNLFLAADRFNRSRLKDA